MYTAPEPTQPEAKPDWNQIPADLKAAIDAAFGSPVVEAQIAWGGYSPSASYGVTLADGSRAFVKGTHPGQTREGHKMMLAEIASYRDLAPLAELACTYRGTVNQGDWHLLLLDQLEDATLLDGKDDAQVRAILGRYIAFQQQCAALPHRPDWLVAGADNPLVADVFIGKSGWTTLDTGEMMEGFISLFTDADAARAWAETAVPRLAARQEQVAQLGPEVTPWGVLHVDMRSDNMLVLPDGSARLIDWPNTCEGPIACDLSGWLPSLMSEGGPAPEQLLDIWHQLGGAPIALDHLTTGLARISGYFMENAWKPCPPPLPRLRWVQKRQLFACLPWLAKALDLPPPPAPKQG